MTGCPCGASNLSPLYIGIQRYEDDRPALVLWECEVCRTTRAIRWAEATEGEKRAAMLRERAEGEG